MPQLRAHIKRQWRACLIAIQFFTRIPIHFKTFDEKELNQAVPYFPLVGILVGSISALAYTLSNYVLPLSLAVLVSMLVSIMLTGAFHEDGLADMADGFGGAFDKTRALEIMVDSRLGSYGAIAIAMALFMKHQSLVALSNSFIPLSLVAAHAISRFFSVLTMHQLNYVKSTGKSKPLATKVSQSQLIIALLFGVAPLFMLPIYFWAALLPTLIAWRFLMHLMHSKIGGYTGDCLGAVQQVTELTFYLGLIACFELNFLYSL